MNHADVHRRSPTMRMPVNRVRANLVLHDGERSDVVLFVSPDEDFVHFISGRAPFIPVIRNDKVCFLTRETIACVGMPSITILPREGELPIERQQATVRFRSGAVLEGELRWVSLAGHSRMLDYLNDESSYFELHTRSTTYHIVKSHVATVEER